MTGTRVLEFGRSLGVAYCGRLLSGFGAEVIKVELPGSRATFDSNDRSAEALSHYYNAGKRSIGLNWQAPEGSEVLRRLLGTANVLLHDLRPDEAREFGLGTDSLNEAFPKLIVVALTGFGQSGPFAEVPSTGFTSYHFGGLGIVSPMYGAAEGDSPLYAGGHQADLQGGSYAALGTLAGMFAQMRGDVSGQLVDVSMAEAIVLCQESTVPTFTYQGISPSRLGKIMSSAPANLYSTRSRPFFIFCLSDEWWNGLVELMGNPDWALDEAFATGSGRAALSDLIDVMVSGWTSQFTAEELYVLAQNAHLPFAPVNTAKELLESAHLSERNFWVRLEGADPSKPAVIPGSPFLTSSGTFDVSRPGPSLGEHTLQVLTDLGFSADKLSEMTAMGIVSTLQP